MGSLPLSGAGYPHPHPYANDGGEEPDGPSATIRFGEQHNQHQVESLAPIASSLEGEEERNERLKGLAGQPVDGSGRDGVSSLSSVGWERQGRRPDVIFEHGVQEVRVGIELGRGIILELLPQGSPVLSLLID